MRPIARRASWRGEARGRCAAERQRGWRGTFRGSACQTGPMSWALDNPRHRARSIVLHELGHFAVAKAVGMRVERFSLFFPPTIVKVKRGETEYAIGAMPLGGYVKISGMNPEEIKISSPSGPRAYYAQPPWKRIVVILAGPGVNILIAFLLFWAILFRAPRRRLCLDNLDPSAADACATTTVPGIERASPPGRAASRRPHRRGRRRRHGRTTSAAIATHRCAGTAGRRLPRGTPGDADRARAAGDAAPVGLSALRHGRRGRMLIGFDFEAGAKPLRRARAAGAASARCGASTTPHAHHLRQAFTSSKARKQIHSIVGITEVAHETVVAGAGYRARLPRLHLAVLAVINLFPFLPLDGGHILWSVAEKLRGQADLAGRDVPLQLGRHRADAVPRDQRHRATTSAASAGELTAPRPDDARRAARTPSSSTSGPNRSGSAGPNSASNSTRLSSEISSHSPRRAEPPVARRRRAGSQWAKGAARGARSGTSTRVSARASPVRPAGSPPRTPPCAPAGRARSRSSSRRDRTRRRRTATPPRRRPGRTARDSRGAGRDRRP